MNVFGFVIFKKCIIYNGECKKGRNERFRRRVEGRMACV